MKKIKVLLLVLGFMAFMALKTPAEGAAFDAVNAVQGAQRSIGPSPVSPSMESDIDAITQGVDSSGSSKGDDHKKNKKGAKHQKPKEVAPEKPTETETPSPEKGDDSEKGNVDLPK